jgi:hypothetical protein
MIRQSMASGNKRGFALDDPGGGEKIMRPK